MNYPSGASTFLTHNGTTFWIVPERDSQPAHCVLRVAQLHGMALVRPLSSNVSPISDVPEPTAGRRRHVPQVRQADRKVRAGGPEGKPGAAGRSRDWPCYTASAPAWDWP